VIAVVVLTFDAPAGMLEACLSALAQQGSGDLPVILIDNGHAAASLPAQVLEPVDLVQTGQNLGFAGGMNVGLRRALAAGATAVVIMNDDVEVQPGWLDPLVRRMDSDDSIGAVQPKLVYPGVPRRINSMGVRLGRDGAGVDLRIGDVDDDAVAERIDLFTGGAVLLNARFLREVGMFDERFFMYYEDVDLGLRGHAAGWTYWCEPASCVLHHGGATASRVGERTAYLRERNRLWILFRHRPTGDIARGVWLSIRRLRWAPRAVHRRALIAGLAGAPALVVVRWRQHVRA
jgi:N-acetylglucosaminyl-diphospho-decaprenol L-rhamnosyltransferase